MRTWSRTFVLFALCVTLAGCDFCGMSSIEGSTKRFVTTVPQGYVSSYILDVGEGKVVLIDAGGNAEATEITDALGKMGKSLSDVEAIVLTHAHSDHIAGLAALGSLPIYAHPGVKTQLGEETSATLTKEIADGSKITFGARTLEFFHMPGHSPGSVNIIVDGMVFFGDTAASDKEGKVRLSPGFFTDDAEQNLNDLKGFASKVEGVEVDTMFFSHSAPLTGKAELEAFVAGL